MDWVDDGDWGIDKGVYEVLEYSWVVYVFGSVCSDQSVFWELNFFKYGRFLFGYWKMLDYGVDHRVSSYIDFTPNTLVFEVFSSGFRGSKEVG